MLNVNSFETWNKEYGREAWEANIPKEILKKKIQDFGTMGLSDKMLSGNPYEFIEDSMNGFGHGLKSYTDTMEKMLRRLELDLYYLKHRSWWFDLKILFLTFTSIVFGKKF